MAEEQVCWVPVEQITEAWPSGEDGGALRLRRNADGGYTLVSGAARLAKLRREGQAFAEALVSACESLDARVSVLLGQLFAGGMNCFEEAEAYQRLLDTGLITRQELASRLGCAASTLQRKLRLLLLNADTRETLAKAGLGERYAHALLRIPGNQGRQRMALHIVERGLGPREAEKLIDETLARMPIPVPRERRLLPLMRDPRLYINAIRGIVDQLCDTGVDASMQVRAGAGCVEVRVNIPSAPQA